jgi:hypothetical protein
LALPSETPTAFFSYSREDSEFALKLAEDLKAEGANVWLDQLDIEPGQRWARAVQEALNTSARVLVILSPASVNSTNVEDEVAFALEEHKTIIPVFYRECKVPFQLRPFQYVDFRADYDRGLKVMVRTLAVKPAPAAAAVAEVATAAEPEPLVADAPPQEEREKAAELQRQAQEGRERIARWQQQEAEREQAEQARLEQEERERQAAEKARLEQEERERQAAAEQARLAAEKRERQEQRRKEAAERARVEASKAPSAEKSPARPVSVSPKDTGAPARSLTSIRSVWGKSIAIAAAWTLWAFGLAYFQIVFFPSLHFVTLPPFAAAVLPPVGFLFVGVLLQCLNGAAFGLFLAFSLGWMRRRFPHSYTALLTATWAAAIAMKWLGTGWVAAMSSGDIVGKLLRGELAVGICCAAFAGYFTAWLLHRAETQLTQKEFYSIAGGYVAAMIASWFVRLAIPNPYTPDRAFALVLPQLVFAIVGNGVLFWQLSREGWRRAD